jgi:hypothetical protein
MEEETDQRRLVRVCLDSDVASPRTTSFYYSVQEKVSL